MIKHAVFPTLVGEFNYEYPQKFKEIFFKIVPNLLDSNGNSNEKTGHVTIHHTLEFKDLYTFISKNIKEFLSVYECDPSLMDAYIVKSWLNIVRDIQTPYHSHADAHISFVYYVNIPDDIKEPLRFFPSFPMGRFEPYVGFTKYASRGDSWNAFNAQCWEYYPTEGSLLIFPATIPHDTYLYSSLQKIDYSKNSLEDNLKKKRISIAGDILLTFKEKTAKAMGLQPIKNWRKFTP